MKKALIFGVAGFVGRYLSAELAANGYEVYGSDMPDTADVPELLSYTKCDLLDYESVGKTIREVSPTHIFNLAGISSVGQCWKMPQLAMSVNVIGAVNILEAVRAEAADCHVLFIGSSEEYEPRDEAVDETVPIVANNPYGISKVALEEFVALYRKEYGLKVYHVRAFNHTGVGQRDSFVIPSWCMQAADLSKKGEDGELHVGNLEVKRDFSDVRDIVRAYRMIVESKRSDVTYNVGSGTAHSLRDILKHIISFADVNIKVVVDEDRIRPNENPLICCNHDRITADLGWEPEYDIYDTIKEMYEYYLHRGE